MWGNDRPAPGGMWQGALAQVRALSDQPGGVNLIGLTAVETLNQLELAALPLAVQQRAAAASNRRRDRAPRRAEDGDGGGARSSSSDSASAPSSLASAPVGDMTSDDEQINQRRLATLLGIVDGMPPLLRFGHVEELVQTLVKLRDIVAREGHAWVAADTAAHLRASRYGGQAREPRPREPAVREHARPLSICPSPVRIDNERR